MKKINYLFFILILTTTTAMAQGVSFVEISGSVGDCTNPTELDENSIVNTDISFEFNQPGNGLGDVNVTHTWVICERGSNIPLAEIPEASAPLGSRNLRFTFQPKGGLSDFPAGLESGVYEIKLRTCYTKVNGFSQTIIVSSENGGGCLVPLADSGQTVCCEISVGCIDYTDCPDVSISFNPKNGLIEAEIPPGATRSGITASRLGETCQFRGTSIIPKRGCWTYTVRAIYPNGCHDIDAIHYCNLEVSNEDDPIIILNSCEAPEISVTGQTVSIEVPSNALGYTFTAREDNVVPPNICTFNSTSVPAKTGCWTYTASALYSNDCPNRETFTFCTNLLPNDPDKITTRNSSNSMTHELKIYPTLFEEIINIEINSDNYKQIQIFSSAGQIVHNQDLFGSSRFSIDSHQFQSGLYFVRLLSDNNQVITRKIIKQ